MTNEAWLDQIRARNEAFRQGIEADKLPTDRTPDRRMLVTCMDPRVNLEAIGIPAFGADGSTSSDVRVVRTIGGMADDRSLIVGIHLAGIREIAFVMHTDCGNCLAKTKIGAILDSLRVTTCADDQKSFRHSLGEPFRDKLLGFLKAFDDPRQAVELEIEAVRKKPFVPRDIILHGLVYELSTARLEVVVDGYAGRPSHRR